MATSTLDPDIFPTADRQLGKGHDNRALGPGDTSDSGSDVCNLATESDSDSHGTGERASVSMARPPAAPESPEAVEQIASDNGVAEDIVDADEKELAKQKKSAREAHVEHELDDALEHTFPASDPVSLTPSKK